MGPIGIPELIIVLVILLVIFGPKRLPALGRSLGSGMREFKESISGERKHDAGASAELGPAPTPVAAERTEQTRASEPRA